MQRLFTYGPGAEPAPTKETEIGEIPEHWEVGYLADLIEIASGLVDPRELPYSKMIHIGPEDVEEGTGRILTPKTAEELGLKSGKYLFTPEDVVYSKIRPYLRKAGLPSFAGICSADMYPLRPKDKLGDRRFLYYILLSDVFTKQAVSHQQRTGIPKINRAQLKSIGIPLPSDIEEQKKITNILDAAVRKIEAELNRKAVLQELFKSMLHHSMTGQVRVKDIEV
jgi:type I restriction enzyme S subunit